MRKQGNADGHAHRSRKRPARTKVKNGPVVLVRVHPDVWALARILADGDNDRITERSYTSVLVVNLPRRLQWPNN